MDEGERKEESSLPPNYVSLAQLQERWLQKQEEIKLKQKQEEEEKRARGARAQKEKNRNQRGMKNDGRAREKGVIQEKGKGKEVVTGEENDKRREVNRGSGRRDFKRAEKVKLGVEGEELGAGLDEICNVSVIEVLPRNGVEEIADVKRTDLRGGFRGNGRNRGSGRVHELEQSEIRLDLEKKVESERVNGKNWRGRGRRTNGGYGERLNGLKEFRPVSINSNKVDSELEKKAGDEVSEVHSEISSLNAGDRNGIRGWNSKGSNKAEVDRVEGEGSNGDKMALEIEKKADHVALAGESAKIGENRGVVKGYRKKENRWRDFGQDRRYSRPEVSAEKDGIVGKGSNGYKVELEIEKKVEHVVLAGERTKIGENRGIVKGYQRNENLRSFGQERRYTRRDMPDSRLKMHPGENGMVWVKKEEKFGA